MSEQVRCFAKICGLALALAVGTAAIAQERYASGPYQGFVKERPELNKTESPDALKVADVRGVVVRGEDEPLPEVWFEIRDKSGDVRSVLTDSSGRFEIPDAPPGKYEFKVTRDGFQSLIGTIIVSPKFSQRPLHLQIELGT